MAYKWKPSKSAINEYKEKKDRLDTFLKEHSEIISSTSKESFYFMIDDKYIRVSNHTIAKSDSGMLDEFGNMLRDSYHKTDYDICVTASPLRLPEIYQDLKAGIKLNKRGVRI
jgi:hypothetical protein